MVNFFMAKKEPPTPTATPKIKHATPIPAIAPADKLFSFLLSVGQNIRAKYILSHTVKRLAYWIPAESDRGYGI